MSIKNKSSIAIFILLIIILTHAFILTKLIFFPYPELFVYPYLTNHGLKPYAQILDQHFPGLLFLPVNFDNLGLTNEVIARYWSIGIVVLIHLFIFIICSKILQSKTKALLANILFLIWHPIFEGWILWIDSFLPLILLPAFYAFYSKRWFMSGILVGLGIIFKQTLIPLCLLIILYMIWKKDIRPGVDKFILGISIPLVCMIVYFISLGVIKDFWYWTLIFNLTIYTATGNNFSLSFGFLTRILFVYSSSILIWLNEKRFLRDLVFIFLVGSLAGALDRPAFLHFQPSLPFAILATTIGFYNLKLNNILKLALVFYFLVISWWTSIFYKGHISSRVFFFDENTKKIASKITSLTKKGDKIFIYGAPYNLYSMTETIPAGDIFVFQFPWFLQASEDRIYEGLISDKPKIVIYDPSFESDGEKLKDYSQKIFSYVETNYKKIDNVGNVEILRVIK